MQMGSYLCETQIFHLYVPFPGVLVLSACWGWLEPIWVVSAAEGLSGVQELTPVSDSVGDDLAIWPHLARKGGWTWWSPTQLTRHVPAFT